MTEIDALFENILKKKAMDYVQNDGDSHTYSVSLGIFRKTAGLKTRHY
jgi:hypothetical protein